VNSLVLSGANTIVLWGACQSCYQAHRQGLSHCQKIEIRICNSSNYKTLGLPLTAELRWVTMDSPQMETSHEFSQGAAP
jgi:hypothetical protein